MSTGEFFVQLHRYGKSEPEEPIYFAGFATTIVYVRSHRPADGDILRVHVPARATDAERHEVIDARAVPI
jgi:hypothetical protein